MAAEILQLMVEGLTMKEPAKQLYISFHTVDTHSRNIYDKLHVHSRSRAVAKACGSGCCEARERCRTSDISVPPRRRAVGASPPFSSHPPTVLNTATNVIIHRSPGSQASITNRLTACNKTFRSWPAGRPCHNPGLLSNTRREVAVLLTRAPNESHLTALKIGA
ncbi:MAG: response regulator transcription factor [Acidobacteriota bacterium]